MGGKTEGGPVGDFELVKFVDLHNQVYLGSLP